MRELWSAVNVFCEPNYLLNITVEKLPSRTLLSRNDSESHLPITSFHFLLLFSSWSRSVGGRSVLERCHITGIYSRCPNVANTSGRHWFRKIVLHLDWNWKEKYHLQGSFKIKLDRLWCTNYQWQYKDIALFWIIASYFCCLKSS